MAEETNNVSLSFWDAGLVEVCRQAPRLLLTTKKQAARRPRTCTRLRTSQSGRLMLALSLSVSDPIQTSNTLSGCKLVLAPLADTCQFGILRIEAAEEW